ncbi:kinase-like domain-containing protein [Rhizophagus clarus]|uniref:Kinase-like domain-containing protein n=1 Tax=Rhizophagus clarus TaxID=94130 RepID=A0A8H3LA66_9GLOM|nr:kinase-like domain-containing protein [Rhizophagus clarus]
MERVNDKNSFDPTPKLKSSPIPILFVSFDENDDNCFNCGEKYVEVPFCKQKYCKKCFSHYISYLDDFSTYLDVYYTLEPQNIQEYIEIIWIFYALNKYLEKYCKLCKKSLYQGTDTFVIYGFKLCSDCYQISSGWIKSSLTNKPIPIIYLPWWYNISHCESCGSKLTFTSECQKYCTNCLIIFIGCRYCLITNIIFGFTNQSQCKKCKRVSSITVDIANIKSGNSYLDDFLLKIRVNIHNNLKIAEFNEKIKKIGKYFLPMSIGSSIYQTVEGQSKSSMEWIPYSQFTNIKEIGEGGFDLKIPKLLANIFLNEVKFQR